MEQDNKLKNFFYNPKKTALFGLIGSAVIFLYYLQIIFTTPLSVFNILLSNAEIVGTLVYFIIVFLRLNGKKGNIKFAKYFLIISFIVVPAHSILSGIVSMFGFYYASYYLKNTLLYLLITLPMFIITILYLRYILFKKSKKINNKVFAIATIIYVIFLLIRMYRFNLLITLADLCILTRIPYFYIYYELLKDENNMVSKEDLKAINVIEECKKCKKEITAQEYINNKGCCNDCNKNIVKENKKSQGESNSEKDWLTTLLLCIFLGGIGVHNFYVGKTGKGILYIFTSGLLGIGTLIDLINICTGKFTDKYGNIISNKQTAKAQNSTISGADELKKYKELLDSGVITQEEFEAKKKQILDL